MKPRQCIILAAAFIAVAASSYTLGSRSNKKESSQQIPAKQTSLGNIQYALWTTDALQQKDYKTIQQMADTSIISNLGTYMMAGNSTKTPLKGELTDDEKVLLEKLKEIQTRSLNGQDIVDYQLLIQQLRQDGITFDLSITK